MATVGGVSSSNANSLYGNRNILSGLASGLDTESMIENSVSGIRLKISGLQQKQTKLQWKQEAYRGLIDQMVQFSRKYTSFTSSTNLFSASFFNNAIITSANGKNAEKVSAAGRSSSSVQLNGVAQLATASRYQVSNSAVLNSVLQSGSTRAIQASDAVDLMGDTQISALSGTLTLNYSNQPITLNFPQGEVYETPEDFKAAIEEQLKTQQITLTDGNLRNADEMIKVELTDGKISFSDNTPGNNSVYISGATGKLGDMMGKPDFSGKDITSINLKGKTLTETVVVMDQIAGKSMSFNLDGSTKKITVPTKDELTAAIEAAAAAGETLTEADAMTQLLQKRLATAFGSGKVTVTNEADQVTDPGKLQLSFSVDKNSSLVINSEANTALGLKATASTYLNTGATLGELMPGAGGQELDGLTDGTLLMADGAVKQQTNGTYTDTKGNLCNANGERLGKDGQLLYGYNLEINGVKIGTYTRDTALETVMRDVNNNTEAGVSLTYSKTTNQFVFTAKETGEGRDISISGGLGEAIFGTAADNTYTSGQDAIVNMTVNGTNMTVKRSSNTFEVDGLTLTLKGTFNGSVDDQGAAEFDFLNADGTVDVNRLEEPITFTTVSDSDKIVDAIKAMVEDYNALMTSLREAFSTLPAQNSRGAKYEPLTDADRESMSDTAIQNYEEQAKQGLLFGDSDLRSMYNKLLSAITPGGADGATLRNIGIKTEYSQGLTTINLDEGALRNALASNPDSVKDAFTKVKGDGSTTNGLMQSLKTQMDAYASVEGTKGILVNKAGSKYSATSLLSNYLQKQIDNYSTQIETWQTKLTDKVDYYTRQFTRLEQLVSQMNSQSSSIMSLMGTGQ